MTDNEIRIDILSVCKVAGWDGDFNVTAFHLLCDKLKQLGAEEERKRFYGQDKPAECSEGCPPKQICDYCQVVAPVKAMILAEREACIKIVEDEAFQYASPVWSFEIVNDIKARGDKHD